MSAPRVRAPRWPSGAVLLPALAALALALRPDAAGAQGAPDPSGAAPDTTTRVRFGAFVDGYYAWDVGRPPARDRAFAGGTALFLTQPARHDEFNVNLAFAEAVVEGPRVRGRLAVQAGTSVQANYAGEPATGQVAGPALARLLQEATAGVRVAPGVWVDGGIFFSHMGMESWISRDNPTYTRSLVAEYSPYYSSGVKLTWAASERLAVRVDVVNGWQNISESDGGKGVGARLDWTPAAGATVSGYTFASEEAGTRLRLFNGVGARVERGPWTVLGELDLGAQRRAAGAGSSTWTIMSAIARRALGPRVAVSARVERAADGDQVVIATGTRPQGSIAPPNEAFDGAGASLGVDVRPEARVLWRTELRGWRTQDAIFPDGTATGTRRTAGFAVTSLALTF